MIDNEESEVPSFIVDKEKSKTAEGQLDREAKTEGYLRETRNGRWENEARGTGKGSPFSYSPDNESKDPFQSTCSACPPTESFRRSPNFLICEMRTAKAAGPHVTFNTVPQDPDSFITSGEDCIPPLPYLTSEATKLIPAILQTYELHDIIHICSARVAVKVSATMPPQNQIRFFIGTMKDEEEQHNYSTNWNTRCNFVRNDVTFDVDDGLNCKHCFEVLNLSDADELEQLLKACNDSTNIKKKKRAAKLKMSNH
ncbi:hypothetical protein BC829DRAFT_261535 [Chytridium lagenaria]|nr:hypothetical protein BC829DRAFT_261535 [Chytridium lagenaria]